MERRKRNSKLIFASEKDGSIYKNSSYNLDDMFRVIVENSGDCIIVFDGNTKKVVFANAASVELFGYSQDSFSKLSIEDFHPNESLSKINALYSQSEKGKLVVEKFIPCMKREGTIFYADLRVVSNNFNGLSYITAYFSDNLKTYAEMREMAVLVTASESLIEMESTSINYQLFVDTIAQLSGADFVFMNINSNSDDEFETVAQYGLTNIKEVARKYLGFEIIGKKWKYDPIRDKKIKDRLLTRFDSLSDLTGNVLPSFAINLISKIFTLGEAWIAKIVRQERAVGDFTLLFSKEKKLRNPELTEIFARMVGLILTRLKLEDSEKKLRSRFRVVLDAVPDLVFAKDYDGVYLMANKIFAETYGFTPKEIVGKTDKEIGFNEEDSKKYLKFDREVIDSGESKTLNIQTRTKDGSYSWYEITKLPIDMPGCEKGAVLGIATDVTQKKQVVDLLKERDNLLANLSAQLPGVVYQFKLNPDGTSCFPFSSEGVREIFEFEPEDIKHDSKLVFERVHPDDLERTYKTVMESAQNLTDWAIENRVILPKKGLRWLSGYARPEKMEDGSIIWHGYTRDITDRKLLEEKQNQLMHEVLQTKEALEINLAQKNQLLDEITKTKEQLETAILEKDRFFSIIAHDLRSPFNGFLGLSKLIVEEIEYLSKEEVKDLTLSIKNSAESLYALLENLLECSRIKRGKISFNPVEMDLSLLIKNNISIIKANLINKELSLYDSIESGLSVYADANMLNAVVRNLLSNAVKFTRRGGSIYITALKSTGRALVTIKDTGIGISDKYLSNLFNVTQKTSQPGTEGESSTGLGLILCKEYIEIHKGKIWVESQLGQGTAFHFTLPNAPKR